jgi:hypothetical protein
MPWLAPPYPDVPRLAALRFYNLNIIAHLFQCNYRENTNMEHKSIKSSNLISGCYDPESKCAEVKFKNGTTYRCEKGISPEEWAKFEATFDKDDSSGSHYHKHLRSKNWRKV